MASIVQKLFGLFNTQQITQNNFVVGEQYLSALLTVPNNPSDTNAVILALYEVIDIGSETGDRRELPPLIEEKIEFNNLVLYKEHVESTYCENGYYIDAAYEALDFDTPGRRNRFLKYINSVYITAVGRYLAIDTSGKSRIEVIRANSDAIFTEVMNCLLLRVTSNSTSISHLSGENIELNIIAIVCHAFVDCKVLENPNKKNL